MSMPAQVFVPREHVNDDSVIVLKVHHAHGAWIDADTVVLDIETSKTTVEITTPQAGYLWLQVTEQDEVDVGALLFEVYAEQTGADASDGSMESEAAVRPAPAAETAEPVPTDLAGVVFSRPAAQRMQELSLAPERFAGQGWVTVDDVEAMRRAAHNNGSSIAAPAAAAASTPNRPAPARALPLAPHTPQRRTKRKRAESDSLTYYGNPLPQSTIGTDVAVPGERTVKPPPLFRNGISDLVIYETAKLLAAYPELNAFHIDERTYGVYEVVNFGVSFDSGRNLKVLTLEHADRLSLGEVQSGVEELLEAYESERPLDARLLQGATVTLSDLTQMGAGYMLPLLNGPQSLILGLTAPKPGTYSLYASFDHRIAEGLLVSRFLEELGERVASYFREADGTANLRCHACDKAMAEEVALGGRGFLNVRLPGGDDALLCRNCFEGL